MSFKTTAYENAAKTILPKFEKRGMTACYCATKEEACEKILSLMPKGSSIAWGGSESMIEAGVMDAIKNGDYTLIDRHAGKTPEESRAIYGQMVCADFHLMSTNAFTKDGMLVNIDGAANRVACLAYGPKNVIVLASMNKLCDSVEAAVKRIRTQAAPPNAIRVGVETPCAKTGVCADCLSPGCICDQILITRKSMVPGRIIVVLCGEELGF
ncbi:MAG: lactate utilization protein [Fusicatenibacter sp.]|nr:lactate utilization protein [Lachnospiraceae bacterium]MDY2938308.1 lactate utilization protein [Fusicatenibacter sp.]